MSSNIDKNNQTPSIMEPVLIEKNPISPVSAAVTAIVAYVENISWMGV